MTSEYREDARAACRACSRAVDAADIVYGPDGSVSCAACEDARRLAAASNVAGTIKKSWVRNLALTISKVMRTNGWR